jgi:hypothetical protein
MRDREAKSSKRKFPRRTMTPERTDRINREFRFLKRSPRPRHDRRSFRERSTQDRSRTLDSSRVAELACDREAMAIFARCDA